MSEHSDSGNDKEKKRRQIIGFGEKSLRKSYYPQLQNQIEQLNKTKVFLEQRTEELLNAMRDLQKERTRAEESERKYRMIVETANEGIWVLGPDTVTTFINPKMAEILGCLPDEIVGRPISDFVPEEDLPELYKRMEKRRSGISEIYECRFLRKDRCTVWTIVSATPIFTDEHHFNGSFAMITDITGRKRAEEKLHASENRLKSLNENLENIIAKRTREVHELSKALTLAEQRERKRMSQMLHENLLQILLSANLRIGMLLSDVKDNPELTQEVSEMKQMTGMAISSTKALAVEFDPPILRREGLDAALRWLIRHFQKQYGLEVTAVYLNPCLEIDPDIRLLLVQLVRELFLNVVKHAKTNKAELSVRCKKNGLSLIVRDRGFGFDVVSARKTAKTREFVGLFSIEERLALIGGQIKIVSVPGKGTLVQIKVPTGVSFFEAREESE